MKHLQHQDLEWKTVLDAINWLERKQFFDCVVIIQPTKHLRKKGTR